MIIDQSPKFKKKLVKDISDKTRKFSFKNVA